MLYQELINKLDEQYGYVPQNERQREIIREEAIQTKIALSTNESASASIIREDDYGVVDITRNRFEEISELSLLKLISFLFCSGILTIKFALPKLE